MPKSAAATSYSASIVARRWPDAGRRQFRFVSGCRCLTAARRVCARHRRVPRALDDAGDRGFRSGCAVACDCAGRAFATRHGSARSGCRRGSGRSARRCRIVATRARHPVHFGDAPRRVVALYACCFVGVDRCTSQSKVARRRSSGAPVARRGAPRRPGGDGARVGPDRRAARARGRSGDDRGSVYDRELAALAIKQARGDLIEAIFLVRAYRTTLPRLAMSLPLETGGRT